MLALDCGQGVVGESLCDASRTEVVPDERVARPSIGENGGATLGEASVVDEPCAHESLERFRAYLRRDTALRELAVDLRGAPVTMAQESKGSLDGRVRPLECRVSSRREPLPRHRLR